MWSCEHHSGRLIEIRLQGSTKIEDLVQLRDKHVGILTHLPGQVVILTDVRKVHLFQSDTSDTLIAMMAALNPRIERSAILVSESALVRLQASRVIQESGQTIRRLFDDPADLLTWLGEVLTGEELARARLFLAEG